MWKVDLGEKEGGALIGGNAPFELIMKLATIEFRFETLMLWYASLKRSLLVAWLLVVMSLRGEQDEGWAPLKSHLSVMIHHPGKLV